MIGRFTEHLHHVAERGGQVLVDLAALAVGGGGAGGRAGGGLTFEQTNSLKVMCVLSPS